MRRPTPAARARAPRSPAGAFRSRPARLARLALGVSLALAVSVGTPAGLPVELSGDAPPGATVVDSVGPPDALRVRRTRVPDDFALPTLLPGPWRVDFEWTLGRDGPDLVVVDGRGVATRFAPRRALGGGDWRWIAPDGAAIDGARGRYALRAADGTVIEFDGRRPVRARTREGGVASWRYESDRLVSHTAAGGSALALGYGPDGALVEIASTGGALRYATPGVDAGEGPPAPAARARRAPDTGGGTRFGHCPARDRCDPDSNPPPASFARGPTVPGALALDVRPGHCGSHFDEPANAVRGDAIEAGLAGTGPHASQRLTAYGFPAADFVGEREIVVVRSRDLASPTYDEPGGTALRERLLRDGRDVERLLLAPLREEGHVRANVADDEPGVRSVEAEPPRAVVLELVVRHGLANPLQVAQIERARAELAARHGIVLRVVEIP